MASHRTSTRNRGFTLIEVVIVMALISFVAGFGLIVSMETYRGDSFRSERDTLVALLQRARGQAIHNICVASTCSGGRAHGVFMAEGAYVLFEGESYATREEQYDEEIKIRYTGMATTAPSLSAVVFSPRAGTTTGLQTISLRDAEGVGSSTITISPMGQITWTQ